MMKIDIYNQNGEKVGQKEVSDKIFGVTLEPALIQQAVVAQLSNRRRSTAHTKTRGEVRGGGAKPWRQKGTGRARQGSIRSPLWVGGGVTFGPRNDRNYTKSFNKKARRKAILMSLSERLREGHVALLDSLKLQTPPKTKEMATIIKKLPFQPEKKKKRSLLLVTSTSEAALIRSSKNIPDVTIIRADSLNVVDIMQHKHLIILQTSLPIFEKTYSQEKKSKQ